MSSRKFEGREGFKITWKTPGGIQKLLMPERNLTNQLRKINGNGNGLAIYLRCLMASSSPFNDICHHSVMVWLSMQTVVLLC